MTESVQGIMRGYGDRAGRGRLRADASPIESRPPQGNAIITGEFPPDIGESGTARYFMLELREGDVDLNLLSNCQEYAASGSLQRCMFGYLEWLKEMYPKDDKSVKEFVADLKKKFEEKRSAFQTSGILCHGRVPEMVAWLQMGMEQLLKFLQAKLNLDDAEILEFKNRFQSILYKLAERQAESII